LKVAPTSLLADQLIFPVELASSVRVTVQGADRPHVLESKLAGLTDQVRIGVGDGDGEGLGDGDELGLGDGDGDGEGLGNGDGDGDADGLGNGDGVGVTAVRVKVTLTVAFPPLEVILIVPAKLPAAKPVVLTFTWTVCGTAPGCNVPLVIANDNQVALAVLELACHFKGRLPRLAIEILCCTC
jgi:TrAA12-like